MFAIMLCTGFVNLLTCLMFFLVNKKLKLRKIVAKFTEMKEEEENHAEIKISNLLFCSFLDRVPKFQAMECHYH